MAPLSNLTRQTAWLLEEANSTAWSEMLESISRQLILINCSSGSFFGFPTEQLASFSFSKPLGDDHGTGNPPIRAEQFVSHL